ncbi:MAG: hypothetical protein EPO29_00030 [Betaproteobacteria bacterium]|nr:MAG: hypothetical protein EPO29_00030 [Betaproteobacteria bacterium]
MSEPITRPEGPVRRYRDLIVELLVLAAAAAAIVAGLTISSAAQANPQAAAAPVDAYYYC